MAERAYAGATATQDQFLGGRLLLRQPAQGHRAGSDAVLLAAAAPQQISGRALDVGAGVGAAGLALAALRQDLAFGLIEKDPDLAALACENLRANGFAEHGAVHATDVLDRASRQAGGLADAAAGLIITNPPFLDEKTSRASPDAGKRMAHVMPAGVRLEDWIASCLSLLAEGGVLVMIHRPEALPAMLAGLAGQAGEVMLKPIQPQIGKPAVRLLLRAKKGSRGPLAIAAPLVLHEGPRFTAEAEALHRGQALIDW
jgi:tRNA1(Val) A37 N6-methylase TrmN6